MNTGTFLLGFRKRLGMLGLLLSLGFMTVLVSYYNVQVLSHDHYSHLGRKYRIKERTVLSTRGLMYDREQRLITRNLPSYNLIIQRDDMNESYRTFLPKVSSFLDLDPEALRERYLSFSSHLLSHPIPIKEDVSFEEVLMVLRNQARYPGLAIQIGNHRDYVFPDTFSHVLGYVAEASQDDLEKYQYLHLGDMVGKRGLERAYDQALTGKEGKKNIHIDSRGLIIEEEMVNPPKPGQDLILTLDLDLQTVAQESLGANGGVVLLMDVRQGDLLVYYSAPSFDLNTFSKKMTKSQWESLLNQEGNPLFNRPIQGYYAPGSLFKLVTVLAALHSEFIHPGTTFYCSGSFQYMGTTFHCHKRTGHGKLDLWEAIQKSCNVYMFEVASQIGAQELAATAHDLGLGQLTGLDVQGEKKGLVPSPQWKKQTHNQRWYPGETLNMSIGQGDVQTTPIQLLKMMASIGSGGHCVTPRLVKVRGNEILKAQESRCSKIAKEHFRTLQTAMWQVVNSPSGTGSNARIHGFDVCGKTGTAQLLTFRTEADRKLEKNTNAWFAGFAPLNDPQVAIIVLVESVGAGGAKAAPVGREVLRAYYEKYGIIPSL